MGRFIGTPAVQWPGRHDQTNEIVCISFHGQGGKKGIVMNEEPSLKEQIVEALKSVYDPEIPVDIYELGLIYEINVYPVDNVYILMTLTSPACPAAEIIPV